MQKLLETIRQQDSKNEYQMRLQLRAVLSHALALLTDPDVEPEDADRIIAMIEQVLKDTAP